MILKHSDGWPRTFNLVSAARITDTTVAALRTMIARGLLNFIGQRPLAGAERRFTVAGIYEIALIDELERNGLTQIAASQVIKQLFGMQIETATCLYLLNHPEVNSSDRARNLACVEADPNLWIGAGILGERNLSEPQLMLFVLPDDYPNPLTKISDGWLNVPQTAIDFQRDIRTFGRSTPDELAGYREKLKQGVPVLPDHDPDVQSGLPVIHILNITSVLCRVDARIADFMDGVPRTILPLPEVR